MKLRKHFLFLALLIIAFSFVLASCGLFNKKCKHEYIDEVVAPTCDTNGYTQHTCKKCDDTYKDSETAPTGHNYVDTVIEASCTAEGYTNHTCSNCGDSYNDNYLPISAHRFNGATCFYCKIDAPTDTIVADTEWYNENNVVFVCLINFFDQIIIKPTR